MNSVSIARRVQTAAEYGHLELRLGRDQRGVAHVSGYLRVELRLPGRRIHIVEQFLRIFIDIVLWRRVHRTSRFRAAAGHDAAAYVLVGVVQLALLDDAAATWLVFLLTDPALADPVRAGWLMPALRRPERFLQTATACSAPAALLGVVLYLAGTDPGDRAGTGPASPLAR